MKLQEFVLWRFELWYVFENTRYSLSHSCEGEVRNKACNAVNKLQDIMILVPILKLYHISLQCEWKSKDYGSDRLTGFAGQKMTKRQELNLKRDVDWLLGKFIFRPPALPVAFTSEAASRGWTNFGKKASLWQKAKRQREVQMTIYWYRWSDSLK